MIKTRKERSKKGEDTEKQEQEKAKLIELGAIKLIDGDCIVFAEFVINIIS